MNLQIDRIKAKLSELKKLDKGFTIFGSEKHKYKLWPILKDLQIKRFELDNQITLPKEYVAFLTQVGDGGAGPLYGLETLGDSLYDDLDYKRPDGLLNPSKPFIHSEAWNMDFTPSANYNEAHEEYEENKFAEFEEMYSANKWVNGAIAICNFGCGIKLNLVVNGREYGHIWTDDRANDGGIYPSTELGNTGRITFLDWYESWLDNSLQEIVEDKNLQSIPVKAQQQNTTQHVNRPWWKFW